MSSPPPSSSSPQFSEESHISSNRRSFFSRNLNTPSTFSLASIRTVLPQYSPVDAIEPESPPYSDGILRTQRSESTSRSKPRRKSHKSHSPSEGTAAEQFEYAFPIRPSNSWCTLRLYTPKLVDGNPKVSHHKPKTPKFWGGQDISGVVELELDSLQTIQRISITLQGKVVTSSLEGGSYYFLDHDVVLWDRLSGDPRSSPSPNVDMVKNQFDGKFIGQYKFPFCFPFPTHVDLSNSSAVFPPSSKSDSGAQSLPSPPPSPNNPEFKSKRHSRPWSFVSPFSANLAESSSPPTSMSESRKSRPKSVLSSQILGSFATATAPKEHNAAHFESTALRQDEGTSANIYPIPQSFLEAQVTVNVGYELGVHIQHGRFRPDSRIKTNISYVPSVRAKSPSSAESQLYGETNIRPHPNVGDNSACWFALPTVNLEIGIDGRDEKVECTLQLAKPLSYTRGTSIPCRLILSSPFGEALGVVGEIDAPYVRLRRHIRYLGPSDSSGGGMSKKRNISPIEEQNAMRVGHITGNPFQSLLPDAAARPGKGRGSLVTLDKEVSACLWRAPQSRPWEVGDEKVDLSGRVCLEGEIQLSYDMRPSSTCPIFCVEYFVEMLPFRVAGYGLSTHTGDLTERYQGSDGVEKVFLKQLIEVATRYPSNGEIVDE